MGKEDADGYVRVKIDVDTSQEKEIKRSLEDIQDDADNAKRKLDALKEAGVDENVEAYRKAAADLEKYNKEIDECIRKQKEAEAAAASRAKATKTGDFDSISDQVEDYETRLRMLRDKGYGPGDGHFDELYIAWKNAADAEKEYLAGLEKLTDRGKELEAERARKEVEAQQKAAQALEEKIRRQEAAERKAAEAQRKREEAERKRQEELNRKKEEEARREAALLAENERLKKIKREAEIQDEKLVELTQEQEKLVARMEDLKRAGVGAGYKEYDDLYILLKNITNQQREYQAQLDKMTDKGIADEAAKKEAEAKRQEEINRKKEAAAQREAQKQEQINRKREAAAKRQEEINRKKEAAAQREAKKREEEARKLAEQAAEYEHLNKLRANAQVRDKDLVKLLERQEAITARMAELKRAGVGEGYKEYDSLSQQLKDVNSSIAECRDGLKRVGKSSKKTLETLNKNTRKSSGMFGMLASRLKGLALSLIIFNWISKGFNAMVAAMKEGFKNLASYSKEYSSVMSAFMSSLAELKNNLAAAFEPIVNTVVPYLTRMVSGLNAAIESFSRFIAYMSGKNTYTRAKKQMLDYKSTVDSTNKSLADFDKLHVLNDNSSGGEKTGADAFETVNIGEVPESFKQFKNIYESYVKPVFERFKEAITWFGGEANGILTNIFGDIADGAGNLWNSIKNLCDQVQPYLEPLFDNIKRLFTILFEVMSGIWESIGAPIFGFIVQLLQDTIDYFAGHTGVMSDAFGEFVDNVEDSWENHLKPALEAIGNFLDEWLLPVFDEVFNNGILQIVGDFVAGIDNLINESLKPVFNGICDFITGIFSGDFEKALNGIRDIFKGIINGIITIVEFGINAAINGLNAFISAYNVLANKVPFMNTLSHLSNVVMPKIQDDGTLSDGGTKNRYTGASHYTDTDTLRTYGGYQVGKNKEGTSVFYGNSSNRYKNDLSSWKNNNGLSNSVKAGSTFGGNENNTYIFEAKLDGQTLFKEVVNQDKLQKKRTGYSALAD